MNKEIRKSLDAHWPFLSDTRHELLEYLEIVDTTDSEHGDIYIPYTFMVNGQRKIHKVYNGWWFLGRPIVMERK